MAFNKKGKEKAAPAASSVAPSAIDELEANKLYAEDPLEALLDEQSDEEFGDLQLKERSGKPVKLAEWSAQDFSSIYLRFRPHLERHARRFLNNPSQIDEVVQDAFLYLMVSLPELDSEIGVLRFLKWKTRLLALDVIRASGRAYINSIDDVAEPASDDPEVSSSLEQQDDAAVVKLALSKLNPRHREVLIASMYEEKTTDEIAAQVGLSENATRQLIFRARAAFKKALIGDVDTTGMSAAAILSVAARKAASEGKRVGAAALTLIALVVMSLTVFPGLNRTTDDQMAGAPTNIMPNPDFSATTDAGNGPESNGPESNGPENGPINNSTRPEDEESSSNSSGDSEPILKPKPEVAEEQEVLTLPSFGDISSSGSSSKIFVLDQDYTVISDNGLTAMFTFNPTSAEVFTSVSVGIKLQEHILEFKPERQTVSSYVNQAGLDVYAYLGETSSSFDEFAEKWTETGTRIASFRLEVFMESNGTTVSQVELTIQTSNQPSS